MSNASDITVLLQRWSAGDDAALAELTPLVYQRLHELAESAFRGESGPHTLQPTAIVHEAYLQLAGSKVDWQGSGHFYALAARMMRRILVNHAKSRQAAKRGGGQLLLTFDDARAGADARGDDVLDLDAALTALDAIDSRKVELLELHCFGGLSYGQSAEALGVSEATVKRDLRFARAWVRRFLGEKTTDS